MALLPASMAANEMVAELLARCSGPALLPLLRDVQRTHATALAVLEAQRLAYEEQGWLADWQAQYDRHTAAQAALTRVIAERFGI